MTLFHLPGLTRTQNYALNAYNHDWLTAMQSSDKYKPVKFMHGKGYSVVLQETDLGEDGLVYTVPAEGFGNLANDVYWDLLNIDPDRFELTADKPECIITLNDAFHKASNSAFPAASAFRKYVDKVRIKLYTNCNLDEYRDDCNKLYADNMKRFAEIYPFYPYWDTSDECPNQRFAERRMEEGGLVAHAHSIDGEIVAIVNSSVDRLRFVHWERTLRTFDPKYQKAKIGLCSTLYLMHQYWFRGYDCFNLGLMMPYKKREFASNDYWSQDMVNNVNLRLR